MRGGPPFHHLAIAQHDDFVGQGADHFQVVANEQIGQAVALLQIVQQIDDLRLNRDIQGRGRLVQHHETGLQHQGPGNGDALALAAGKFMGEAVHGAGFQADLFQGISNQGAPFVIAAAFFVHQQALFDDLGDGHARTERRERVLEDHLHLPAQGPQDPAAQILNSLTLKTDRTLAGDQA